jgi:hypothetical protein
MEKLIKVQNELKAPKNQYNNFGKYKYRNCEDILEAVKPLLLKYNLILYISDEVMEAGDVLYIEATAMIEDSDSPGNAFTSKAQAGIDVNRKGMDIAQSFGSSASYARKYALNGLFLIDDTKDADSSNTHSKTTPARKATPMERKVSKTPVKTSPVKEKQKLSHKDGENFHKAIEWVESDKGSIEKLQDLYDVDKATLKAIKDFIK